MALTVAQLVARVTADTSGFYRGMAIANSSMLRTGGLITRVAAGAGLAVLGMGIMSLRAAGNFEQSMNILQAVSGATAAEIKALRDEAIKLGADMKLPNVSAKDAAESMSELAKGGLSVKDTLAATRGVLQLGIAANMEYAESATIVARALQAFGLEGENATQIADLFTAAANKSTAEMGDIALGFQMASAQFAAGDQTIQALTTSLTLMANAGVIGSDAGTSLKTMMNRLMAPTKKAKDLMADMGIKVYDAAGNMKAMPDIISEFTSATKGMTKEQKNAALYTIFGSDAIRAARIQMRAGEKGWRKMQDSITKGGEAQKFAEARTKGFNGALQAFGSQMETLAILLGTALLPAATSLVRAFTIWLASVDPQRIIDFFAAIADVTKTLYEWATEIPIVTALLAYLLAGFIAFKIITTVVRLFQAATIAFQLMGASLLANPIVLIVVALIAMSAALYVLYHRSETFRKIVDGAFRAVKTAAEFLFNFIKDHWPLLIGIILGPFGIIAAQIIIHWDAIKSAFTSGVNFVMAVLNAMKTAFITVKNVTMAVFGAIAGFFKTWWPLLLAIFALPLFIIIGLIVHTWEKVWAVTQTVWNAIKAVIRTVFNAIKTVVMAHVNLIKTIITTAWNAIKAVTSAVWGTLKGIIKAALNVVLAPIKAILSTIKGLFSAAWNAIGEKILSSFLSFVGTIRRTMGALAGAAYDVGKAIVEGIGNGITALGGWLKDKVVGIAKGALDGAKSWLGVNTPSRRAAEEIGAPITEGIIEGLGYHDLAKSLNDLLMDSIPLPANKYVPSLAAPISSRPAVGASSPMVAQVFLDGNQIAEATFQPLRNQAAQFRRANGQTAF